MILEIQAAAAWHANVHDQATDIARDPILKKGLGVREGDDLIVDRGQKKFDSISDAYAVIDNDDGLTRATRD